MTDKEAFIQEMEQRFGSDEALGVTIVLDTTGEKITAGEYDRRYQGLPKNQCPGGESLLPDGGSAVCCTDYAAWIYKQLKPRARIYGFTTAGNPTSGFARNHLHLGGHDFAIVDERYIVDPWPRLVRHAFQQMVFDLNDPAEQTLILDIYGPRDCWERSLVAEKWAGGPWN